MSNLIKDGYYIEHPGMGSINNLSSFVGLTKKKQGWRCKVQKT